MKRVLKEVRKNYRRQKKSSPHKIMNGKIFPPNDKTRGEYHMRYICKLSG